MCGPPAISGFQSYIGIYTGKYMRLAPKLAFWMRVGSSLKRILWPTVIEAVLVLN